MSSAPLRILVVAAREPWPLNGGGRLLLFHVLRELARRARVTLALPEPPQHPEHLPAGVRVEVMHTSPAPAAATPAHRGLVPLLAARHYGTAPATAAYLRHRARPAHFDVALLNGAYNGQYAPECRVPCVWNPTDELVLHTIRDVAPGEWRRWSGALRRAALYALFERWVARQVHTTVFVSRIDAAFARRWTGAARVAVIENGVDLEYFRPPDTPPAPGTVAFVGSLEFPPNIDGICHFARHAWPRLHAADPARRLLIVGRAPVPAVRALAAQPGVELHADVPDVRPLLARAALVIVPTRKGGGLKNKILEACAVARPVVASRRALGGLSARPGRELLVATTPAEWIARVDALLRDPRRAAAIAEHGLRWVRRRHRWADAGISFYNLLAAAAGPRPHAAKIVRGAPTAAGRVSRTPRRALEEVAWR